MDAAVRGNVPPGLLGPGSPLRAQAADGAVDGAVVQRQEEGREEDGRSASADALREELGVKVTTNPEVGDGKRAYLGSRVTFGLHFAHPPDNRLVRGRQWVLETPGGAWRALAASPTTTLPITTVGLHTFRAVLEVDGVEVEVSHSFEAIAPATRSAELVDEQQAAELPSLAQYEGTLALQSALLNPGDAAAQGAGAAMRISTSAANPAQADADAPATLDYRVEQDAQPDRLRWRWYLKPFSFEGMPDRLGDHARTKSRDGVEAYDLGPGAAAGFPASHPQTYVVLCQATAEDGTPAGEARYLQSIVDEGGLEPAKELEEQSARVSELGDRVAGTPVAVSGAYVSARGTEVALRLYLGKAADSDRRWRLLDLTPGLDPEQHQLDYEGDTPAACLDAFQADNRYPEGAISLAVGPNPLGVTATALSFETDGETLLGQLSSWAGIASLVAGALAVATAPFTGGGSLMVATLLIGATAAGVTAGALSLADHLRTEDISETAVALDVLTIATSFLNAGLAIKALRASPAVLVASHGGRFLLWTNVALEGVSALLVSVDAAEQIVSVVEDDQLAPAEKRARLITIVANLIVTGALLAVSYGDLRRTRGRLGDLLGDAEAGLSDPERMTLSILDDDSLRALRGAEADDLAALGDMLRADPGLAARLAAQPNGRGDLLEAVRAAKAGDGNVGQLELALFRARLVGIGVAAPNAGRVADALDQAGVSGHAAGNLSDATAQALARADAAFEANQVSEAMAHIDAATELAPAVRGRVETALAARHGVPDPGFRRDAKAALGARFPDADEAVLATVRTLDDDAIRVLADADEQQLTLAARMAEADLATANQLLQKRGLGALAYAGQVEQVVAMARAAGVDRGRIAEMYAHMGPDNMGHVLRAGEDEFKYAAEASRLETMDQQDYGPAGHSIARHGPQVTDEQLKARIEKGVAPDGATSKTRNSSRFTSFAEWHRCRQEALDDFKAAFGIELDQPLPGGKTGARATLTKDRQVGTGWRGRTGTKDPNDKRLWLGQDAEPTLGFVTTRLDWNGSRWVVTQHFPDRGPGKPWALD
ncbi:hypothetical protein [Haliangium sp.]|uniref:hypothetical protein n=1 Tax=Haliangium sp. TaxID=2663208 RepID=UPI003D12330C